MLDKISYWFHLKFNISDTHISWKGYLIGRIPQTINIHLRDRPFNLKRGGGELWFLFRSEFLFRTTQELEYLFFCRAKRNFYSRIQH